MVESRRDRSRRILLAHTMESHRNHCLHHLYPIHSLYLHYFSLSLRPSHRPHLPYLFLSRRPSPRPPHLNQLIRTSSRPNHHLNRCPSHPDCHLCNHRSSRRHLVHCLSRRDDIPIQSLHLTI